MSTPTRSRAVESFKNAAETIGKIEHGTQVFAITRGQFSMIDAILHTLEETGPAHISVWTWVIAAYEVHQIDALIKSGKVLSARMIIDRSAEKNESEIMKDWRIRFGNDSIRIVRNHAKIARVWNDDLRVLLRGSMNLNFNPRFEQLDVSEGGPEFDLVTEIEDALPTLPPKPTNAAVDKATQLGLAFDSSTLEMFHGVKTWAK